jgi:hypothetical protein
MKRFSDQSQGDAAWTERCLHEAEQRLLEAHAELTSRIKACRGLPAGAARFAIQVEEVHLELGRARVGLQLAERAQRDGAVDRARICLADVRLHARRACRTAQAAAADLSAAPLLAESPVAAGAEGRT